jgi:hypothetical protein
MNARYRIDEWFHKLEQTGKQMQREDVCFLMVQARHLIEKTSSNERYRLVTFYADWTVHPALDRSSVCFEVLRDITKILAENFNQTKPDITREISTVIGFPKLRSELTNLFRDNNLPIILFEYLENWKGFVIFLLWFIAGQPIRFPTNLKGRAKDVKEEMLKLQRPHNIAVETLAVVEYRGAYHWKIEISGDKEITIIGQVEIAEDEANFLSPPQTGE